MNFWILAAVIAQALVSRADRKAGAICGFLVTGGILLWGLNAYQNGAQIVFFGIALSHSAFVAFCTFWFIYDTRAWRAAKAADEAAAAVAPAGSPPGEVVGHDGQAAPGSRLQAANTGDGGSEKAL